MSQISYPCPYSDPFEIKQSQAGGARGGEEAGCYSDVDRAHASFHASPSGWLQGEHIMASGLACVPSVVDSMCAAGNV